MNPTALQDAPETTTPDNDDAVIDETLADETTTEEAGTDEASAPEASTAEVGSDEAVTADEPADDTTVLSDMNTHSHAHRKPALLPNRVGFVALIAAGVGLALSVLVLFVNIVWFLPLVAIVPAITLGVLGLTLIHHRKLTSIAAIVVALISLVPSVSGYMVMTSTQAALDSGTTAEFTGATPNLDALMRFLTGSSGDESDGTGGASDDGTGDSTGNGDDSSDDSTGGSTQNGALGQPGSTGTGTTTPGVSTPGTTTPGTTIPGTTIPGSTVPGTTVPGTTVPGTTTPGTTPSTPIVDVKVGTGTTTTPTTPAAPTATIVAVTSGSIGSLLATSNGAKVTVNSSTCGLPLVNALGISLNISGVLCAVNVSVTNNTNHVVSINSGAVTGLVGGAVYAADSTLGASLSANVAVNASASGNLYVLLPVGSTKLDTVKIRLGGEPAASLLTVKVS